MTTALSRDQKHYYVRFKLLMGLERATVRPTKGSMGNECAHSGIILTPGMKIIQTKYKLETIDSWLPRTVGSITPVGTSKAKTEPHHKVTLRLLFLRSSQGSTYDGSHGLCHVTSGINLVFRPRTSRTHGSARDSGMVPVAMTMEHMIRRAPRV